MIRDFHLSDIDCFNPNEFSNISNPQVFDMNVFFDDSWKKYTLHVGFPRAFLFAKNYNKNNWGVFVVIEKDFQPVHLKYVRRFFLDMRKKMGAKLIVTMSGVDDRVFRLHEFMQFKLIKRLKSNLNLWVIKNG